ncbi:hypothetical protein ADK43_07835 [Streptomyces rimosus subsp. rimosus]|nr:hypothetical protein ADK43_07835 [Streptomyces rimosus subsp. rimosus]
MRPGGIFRLPVLPRSSGSVAVRGRPVMHVLHHRAVRVPGVERGPGRYLLEREDDLRPFGDELFVYGRTSSTSSVPTVERKGRRSSSPPSMSRKAPTVASRRFLAGKENRASASRSCRRS